MEVRLNSLIQFSELIKAIEFLNSAMLKHDKKLGSLEKDMKARSDDLRSHQTQIDSLVKEKARMSGDMQAITEINRKLESWSSRFTDLESKIFEAYEKINNLKSLFENEMSRIRSDQSRSAASIARDIQDVEKIYHNGQQDILLKLKRLENEFENSKQDKDHMFAAISKELDFLHTNVDVKPEKVQEFRVVRDSIRTDNKGSALSALKIVQMESKLEEITLSGEKKYNELAQDLNRLTYRFDNMKEVRKEIYINTPVDNAKTEQRNQVFSDNQLRNEYSHAIDIINSRLRHLEHKNTPVQENPSSSEQFEKVLMRLEDLTNFTKEYHLKNDNNIEKLYRGLNICSTQSDLEDLRRLVTKKNEQLIKKKTTFIMEKEEKIQEFEGRLIDLWNSNKAVNEKLDLIGHSAQSNAFTEAVEKLKEKFERRIEDTSDAFNKRVKDLYFKIERMSSSFSDIPERSQDHIRSMITLKSELNRLKSSVENINHSKTPTLEKEDIILEEVPENMSSELIQKVLKQHSNAIKVLANRLHKSENAPIQQQIAEGNAHLEYLETLKKEMKEMINQKNSRSVTEKEIELIQQICRSLDQKLNTLEVGHQVDKKNLKHIYQLLKRKIDSVSKEIENKEQDLKSDRPFFIKGRFDSECAACGHNLPNIQSLRPLYSSWARFSSPKNLVGPGFSKILSSLVMNSDHYSLPSSAEKKKIESKNTLVKNKINRIRKG